MKFDLEARWQSFKGIGNLRCESQDLTVQASSSVVLTSSCTRWLTDFEHNARFHLIIVIWNIGLNICGRFFRLT